MRGGQHLYIIQAHTTGSFKVGRSSQPRQRLKNLQTGSPFKLRLILVVENAGHRERELHRLLQGCRTQGPLKGEWFKEPALGELPTDLYEQLDLDMVHTWWLTDTGPVHLPGPG